MRINGLQFNSINNLRIFASKIKKKCKDIFTKILHPIESIQYQIIRWIGPFMDYAMEQKITNYHKDHHCSDQKESSFDYNSMKMIIKGFIHSQDAELGQVGGNKNNIIKYIDGMSYNELKEVFDNVHNLHKSWNNFRYDKPNKESIKESEFLQNQLDKSDKDQ